jgi:hypothetical protein
MATDKESVKKMFPHLYKELENGDAKVSIDALRKDAAEAETEGAESNAVEAEVESAESFEAQSTCMPDKLRHFNPSAVDFLRRCDTEAQAEEIIAYLQKKGEITQQDADQLRCTLKRDGVRGFGAKKEENYYFKEGGIY